MEESELAEIESRILEYPAPARRDILRLTAELRGLRGLLQPTKQADRVSPLFDAVTGILNGGAYGVRFAGAMARATRNNRCFAVMSVDLTFPRDTLDPQDRDGALKLVAQRLTQCVREADTLARIDDQKFAIILEDLPPDGAVEHLTGKVQRALSEALSVRGRSIRPDAAIAVRLYPSAEPPVPRSPLDRKTS